MISEFPSFRLIFIRHRRLNWERVCHLAAVSIDIAYSNFFDIINEKEDFKELVL